MRSGFAIESLFVQYPRSAGDRPLCSNIAAFDGKPQCAIGYPDHTRSLREIQPAFRSLTLRIMAADSMIGAQRCDQCSRPVITPGSGQLCTVEHTGNHLVAINARQHANGLHDILRGVPAAFPASTARQTQRCMHATLPVDKQHDLARLFIDVHNDFADQRSQEPFLRTFIGLRVIPQGLEITRKILELLNSANAR